MRASKEIAILCGKLSDEVYDNCTEVGDLGYTITNLPDITIVAIRGTANKRNVARDINVVPWKGTGSFFTTWGFMRAYKKLEGSIFAELPKDRIYIFTGHSLGGAISTLFAEKLGCGAVTFGSPRVYFRGWYKSPINHTRITMDDDPVTMIPRLMFEHKCDNINIKDRDSGRELIDVSDHFMEFYNKHMDKY